MLRPQKKYLFYKIDSLYVIVGLVDVFMFQKIKKLMCS